MEHGGPVATLVRTREGQQMQNDFFHSLHGYVRRIRKQIFLPDMRCVLVLLCFFLCLLFVLCGWVAREKSCVNIELVCLNCINQRGDFSILSIDHRET